MNELRRFFVTHVVIVCLVATASVRAMDKGRAGEDEEKHAADQQGQVVSQLSKAQADKQRRDGNEALIIAAARGDCERVELLLAYKASIETREEWLATPLVAAAFCGKIDMVQLLLEKKADVKVVDSLGMTALMFAVCKTDEEIEQALLRSNIDVNVIDGDNKAVLIEGEREKHRGIVRLLLANNVDADAVDSSGRNALIHASKVGALPIVDMLIASGAEINRADTVNKFTALAHASLNSHNLVASRLLQARAAVNGSYRANFTPLIIATKRGNKQLMQELIRNNANVNMMDKKLFTALKYACRQEDSFVAKLLIDNKASVDNGIGNYGLLYNACLNGRVETAKLLIERGINIHMEDAQHETALHRAFGGGYIDIVSMLVFFGADPAIIAAAIDEVVGSFDESREAEQDATVDASLSAAELCAGKVIWSAEKLEKLKKDIASVQIMHKMLGEQNWLPELLIESQILSDHLPIDLKHCVDAYATQYVSKNHDKFLDRLVREHIERVQWLQSRRVGFTQGHFYEPAVALHMQLAEKRKDEESREKEWAERGAVEQNKQEGRAAKRARICCAAYPACMHEHN